MQFRDFAENLLASKVKIKPLRVLLGEETITSERELAKLIGVSHGAVNKAMKDFYELNLVVPLRAGNVANVFTEKGAKAKRHEKLMENINKGIIVFKR